MSQHRTQQEWLRLVQKYYNSEQSAAQFCLEHNLHPKTFDNNRRKLHHLVYTKDRTNQSHLENSLKASRSKNYRFLQIRRNAR
jgi:spore germination protein YaaH